MSSYRNIWKKHYGYIPKDENGRSMEIHHINGDHHDNDIANLMLVTIEEHFQLHLDQGDFGACALIMKRMKLPVSFMSDIQKGVKRPGIGGAPKGRIPWNKGKSGYKLNTNRKGRRFSSTLTKEHVMKIRLMYKEKYHYEEYLNEINGRKENRRGGKPLPYERFLSKYLQNEFFTQLTAAAIYAVITRKTWKDV